MINTLTPAARRLLEDLGIFDTATNCAPLLEQVWNGFTALQRYAVMCGVPASTALSIYRRKCLAQVAHVLAGIGDEAARLDDPGPDPMDAPEAHREYEVLTQAHGRPPLVLHLAEDVIGEGVQAIDLARANKEGWTARNLDQPLLANIERLETSARFKSDAEALAFILGEAVGGSHMHRAAILTQVAARRLRGVLWPPASLRHRPASGTAS